MAEALKLVCPRHGEVEGVRLRDACAVNGSVAHLPELPDHDLVCPRCLLLEVQNVGKFVAGFRIFMRDHAPHIGEWIGVNDVPPSTLPTLDDRGIIRLTKPQKMLFALVPEPPTAANNDLDLKLCSYARLDLLPKELQDAVRAALNPPPPPVETKCPNCHAAPQDEEGRLIITRTRDGAAYFCHACNTRFE